MKKFKNVFVLLFLTYISGCVTSGTLVRNNTPLLDNEAFVLFGKARIDVFSKWKEKDQVVIFCKNVITNEELECFPQDDDCLLYTSPSPRDQRGSRMPSSA